MTDSPLLEGLNPPQREAVTTTEGPVMVIAGAGSGKTRVITHRIAYLIEHRDARPWQIFATTFTNKAAREMKERVARLCRQTDTERLAIDTFHSQCARILRAEAGAVGLTPRYTICDDTDQSALMRDCMNALNISIKYLKPRDVLQAISLAKMQLLEGDEAEDFVRNVRDDDQANLYRLYQKRLRDSDAVDFDDLLSLVVRLFDQNPDIRRRYQERYPYVMVDEYQDTNLAQYEMVRHLAGETKNICVVGDEDQSIYSWRGAEIRNLLDFQKHFEGAKVIRLEQNYRSTKNILAAADAVIARNTQRLGKTLWSDGPEGDPVVEIEGADERAEARYVADQIISLYAAGLPFEEMAVFYRVNALSRVYEEALRDSNVPYRVVGGVRFYDRAEIKDLLAYLQVIANPGNTLALTRIINTPRRGVGDAARGRLLDRADEARLTLFEVLMEPKEIEAAGVKGKGAKGAKELADLVIEWTRLRPTLSLRDLTQDILERTGYIESLGDENSLEVMSRKENIQEFLGALGEYEKEDPNSTLEDFLESVALRDTQDQATGQGGVSLMTIHNAKGLEFDVVFIVALEKDIFPNARAVRDQQHNEEERRLFYVGLTRARKRVYVTHATMRRLYGQMNWPSPSIFMYEIPDELKIKLGRKRLEPIKPGPLYRDPEDEAPPGVSEQSPEYGAPASSRLYRHDILGEVEIVEETETATGPRVRVRDRSGREHVLMTAHTRLTPLNADPLDADVGPCDDDEDDDMPF